MDVFPIHHGLEQEGALSPPQYNSPLAYLIRFSFVCVDNESMFIPAASVKAPPNPQIFWYVAVRFSVKTIPVETTYTVILQSVKLKCLGLTPKTAM
jgi:hypothetical protein